LPNEGNDGPEENNVDITGVFKKKITRRKAISAGAKIGVAVVATAVVAGAGGYLSGSIAKPAAPATTTTATETQTQTVTAASSTASGPPPTPTTGLLPGAPATLAHPIIWEGGSWGMYDQTVAQIKTDLGYDLTYKILDYGTIATQLIATKGVGWDVCLGSYHTYPIVAAGDVVKPIPVSSIPRWNPNYMSSIEVDPSSVLTGGLSSYAGILNSGLWPAGEEQKPFLDRMTYGISTVSNWDTVCYNPEIVPSFERGSQMKTVGVDTVFESQYKGQAGWPNDVVDGPGYCANYLEKSGQVVFSHAASDATQAELEEVMDFLSPYVSGGQFKLMWSDYSTAVNVLSTREVALMPTWQPAVYDTRRAGTPLFYSYGKWGHDFWRSPDMLSTQTDLPDLALYSYLNWRASPYWVQWISAADGYTNSVYLWPDTISTFGQEHFDWEFLGAPTYAAYSDWIKQVWPNNQSFWSLPMNTGNALFLPDKYNWSSTQGTPTYQGNLRDCGSVEARNQNVGWCDYWPANAANQVAAWTALVALLPSS